MQQRSLRFDSHQFVRRARPVSIDSELTFNDFSRMNIHEHKNSGERRLETPVWALNTSMLRKLLVVYMEQRLFIRNPKGTLDQRRERIRLVAFTQRPTIQKQINKLCEEFRACTDPARKEKLQIEIENLDTLLRTTNSPHGGLEFVTAIVYLYFLAMYDSVGVGAELGLKGPHVRITLWRLNKLWKEKFDVNGNEIPAKPVAQRFKHRSGPGYGPRPRWDFAAAQKMRQAGFTFGEIAAKFGMHAETVSGAFSQARISTPRVRRGRPAGHRFDHRKALEMSRFGLSNCEIARQLGVDQSTVWYALNKSPYLKPLAAD